jgi:hypothetical protein
VEAGRKGRRTIVPTNVDSGRFFDELASGLSSGSISRRRALRLAGASLVSAVGLASFTSPAEAAATCPRRGAGCETLCKNTRKTCACIRTVSGRRRCVHPCCTDFRTCTSGSQCRRGEVCLKTPCCGTEPVCVRLCSERRPRPCNTPPAARRSAWS